MVESVRARTVNHRRFRAVLPAISIGVAVSMAFHACNCTWRIDENRIKENGGGREERKERREGNKASCDSVHLNPTIRITSDKEIEDRQTALN